MTSARRELKLEVEESDGDSISGRVSDESGRGSDFIGWLGLAGALDDALHPGDHAGRGEGVVRGATAAESGVDTPSDE